MSKQFYFYARKRQGKPSVWYVRFRRKDGSISSQCTSTGQLTKKAAEEWVLAELVAGRLSPEREVAAARPDAPTFAEYAGDWWVWGKCPYMRGKEARGFHFARAYADTRRSYLTHYVVPRFGTLRLPEITPLMVDRWILELRDGDLSPSTCNRILGTLKVMLAEAVRLGLLPLNPASVVGELKEEPKERGILSLEELVALFGPGAIGKVWSNDHRHYACNFLAAAGGLRLGECQGLQVQYVGPSYVRVVHGWNDRYGMQPPKWNSVRIVPIPKPVGKALEDLLALNRWGPPEPDDVLFWGSDRKTPLSKTAILERFKSALRTIGIKEPERRQRNLVFHSYRHGFNTLLRGKVGDEQLRRVTGHKTLQLTEAYDHPDATHLADVLAAQDALFALEPPAPKAST